MLSAAKCGSMILYSFYK